MTGQTAKQKADLAAELATDPLGRGYNGPGEANPGPEPMSDAAAADDLNLTYRASPTSVFRLRAILSTEEFDNTVNRKFLFEFAEDLSDYRSAALSPRAPVLDADALEAGRYLAGLVQGHLGDPPAMAPSSDSGTLNDLNLYDEAIDQLLAAGGCSAAQAASLKGPGITNPPDLNAFQQYIGRELHDNQTNRKVLGSFILDMSRGLSPRAPVPTAAQVQAGGFIHNLYAFYESADPFDFAGDVWAGGQGVVHYFHQAGGCSDAQRDMLQALSNNTMTRAQELELGRVRWVEVAEARKGS